METKHNLTVEGIITLLSPLSHIGEVRGTDSMLVRGKVFDPLAGKPRELFRYNGNAFRGMWRDCGALYLFEKLNDPKMSLDIFHLFTSGGAIAGAQTVDLERAEQIRAMFPLISIFGGGAKSQILEGKMRIGFGVPLVAETQGIIPERFRNVNAPAWRLLTEEVFSTRQDDSKKERFKPYIADQTSLPEARPETPKLEQEQQAFFVDEPESVKKGATKMREKLNGEKPDKKEKDGPAQQMRVMVEALCAGSQLYHRIDLEDMSDLELGCFVSCLDSWSRHPYLGGKSGSGFGLCAAEYEFWDNGERKPFMQIAENCVKRGNLAEGAKQKYDQFLRSIYDHYLSDNQTALAGMLNEAKL
jgi:CRISPR type IV-associated protein Csf2